MSVHRVPGSGARHAILFCLPRPAANAVRPAVPSLPARVRQESVPRLSIRLPGGGRLIAVTGEGERALISYSRVLTPEFAAFCRVLNDLANGRSPEPPEDEERANSSRLLLWIGLMIGCGVLLLVSRLVGGSLTAWLGARIVADLRRKGHTTSADSEPGSPLSELNEDQQDGSVPLRDTESLPGRVGEWLAAVFSWLIRALMVCPFREKG